MIDRAELLRLANEVGLEARMVEKDYVLGWLLAGIFRDPALAAAWVFKGGTCLKKCFFETYRFSEDLDFTITDTAQFDPAFLESRFAELSEWLYETTGIELPANRRRFDVFDNKRAGRACEGRIGYRGPIAPRGGDLPRIKLDLTADEVLVLPPMTRRVGHPYSDEPFEGIHAQCYAFEEVFGEKIRALGERSRPRDLYDVINLFRNGEFHAAAVAVRDVLRRKCEFKGIPLPSLASLGVFHAELAAEWDNMLGHQLPSLPPVDSFWNALPEFFDWLLGAAAPPRPAAYPLAPGDVVLHAAAGAVRIPGRNTPFIEVIRFAASNRLLVELDYVDDEGHQSTRTIEPYSLRRTQEGNVILHAVRAQNQQHRSYRLDRILGAQATRQTFVPRYAIELTPSGPLAIPSSPPRQTEPRITSRTSRTSHASGGPTYIFRCPVCNKRFERKSYDSALRPHKNPSGWDCPGRTGYYEETKY